MAGGGAKDRRLAELMARAQQGDREAYRQLLLDAKQLAGAFIRKRVSSAVDVDDLVQEVLMATHRGRHTYEVGRPFMPWFFAIANYKLMDHMRAHYRDRNFLHELANAPRIDEEHRNHDEKMAVSEELVRALDRLPLKQRRIIEALHLEGKSVQEVADGVGVSPSAVKVSAHRGYVKLRIFLRKDRHE